MKNIIQTLLLLIITVFSINSVADVYQQLTSGNLAQIKMASQTMAAGRENTQKNADILAEILLSKYEHALTTEVDTLSWACKALAATRDGRYKNLLITIYNSDTHSKLRKYARSSYQKLPDSDNSYIKGSIDLTSMNHQEIAKKTNTIESILPKPYLSKKERMLFVIAKGDLRSIKYMAQNIHAKRQADNDIADALSEFILTEYINATDYQIDTLAWICRALGALDNGRYTQVMERVAEKSNALKIRNYAREAYEALPKVQNSYVKGSVNFKDLIQKYKSI